MLEGRSVNMLPPMWEKLVMVVVQWHCRNCQYQYLCMHAWCSISTHFWGGGVQKLRINYGTNSSLPIPVALGGGRDVGIKHTHSRDEALVGRHQANRTILCSMHPATVYIRPAMHWRERRVTQIFPWESSVQRVGTGPRSKTWAGSTFPLPPQPPLPTPPS